MDLPSLVDLLGNGYSDVLAAAIVFIGTAALVALCVPGVILPLALASGALLGTWPALAVVGLGTLAGSQILFLLIRYLARDRARARLGSGFRGFERRFAAYGPWYVLGLRLLGAPHFVVTASSALMPIGAPAFALATLLGLLPAIAVAAAAGATI